MYYTSVVFSFCFFFFYKLFKLPLNVLLQFTIYNVLNHKEYREYNCCDTVADSLRLNVGFGMVHLYIPTDFRWKSITSKTSDSKVFGIVQAQCSLYYPLCVAGVVLWTHGFLWAHRVFGVGILWFLWSMENFGKI